ncbi:MAG: DUF1638 domain-containing protein [Coprobacillaceae bacterium]
MIKIIACRIFKPYIEQLVFEKKQYDIIYLDIRQHEYPNKLAKEIQKEIDISENYQNIIILYGLCGGALLQIKAREIPLLLVKIHDCMSILLGSKEAYHKLTQDTKSISWSCYSLKEEECTNVTSNQWRLLYDEEMVEYLLSVLKPEPEMYISLGLFKEAKYIENEEVVIQGSLKFLQDIITMQSTDTLYLYKNEIIKNSLDNEVIVKGETYGNIK